MGKPINIDRIKFNNEIPSTENTVPFEVEAPKKLNYYKSDVLLIDLAELVDMNPLSVNDNEKNLVKTILEDLSIDIESKVMIEIITSPIELGYLVLKIIRRIPSN